jgi:hypothetical protein
MTTDNDFTIYTAMREICRGVIDTVGNRRGDSEAKRANRKQTAAVAVTSFLPRDPLETMVAGHCVIYDQLLHDGANAALHSQSDEIRLRTSGNVYAAGKMFLAHLEKFEALQARAAEKLSVRPPAVEEPAAPDAASAPPRQSDSDDRGQDEAGQDEASQDEPAPLEMPMPPAVEAIAPAPEPEAVPPEAPDTRAGNEGTPPPVPPANEAAAQQVALLELARMVAASRRQINEERAGVGAPRPFVERAGEGAERDASRTEMVEDLAEELV